MSYIDNPATAASIGAITGGANVNVDGVGVFDGQTGTTLNFCGIKSESAALTAALDAVNKTVDLTLDPGLNALASLGAGIAVSDGADGWFARSIAVTDTASVNLTVTNASGVGGNPTIQADVLAAGVDHGGLAGLGDDDHLQYTLRAGRATTTNDTTLTTTAAGTGSLYGASTATGNLTLRANSVDFLGTTTINSTVDLWPNEPAPSSALVPQIGLEWAPTWSSTTTSAVAYGISLDPTVTIPVGSQIIHPLHIGGLYQQDTAPGINAYHAVDHSAEFRAGNSALEIFPDVIDLFSAPTGLLANAVNITQAGNIFGYWHEPHIEVTAGAPAQITFAIVESLRSHLVVECVAGSIVNIGGRIGLDIYDIDTTGVSGTLNLSFQQGVSVQDLTGTCDGIYSEISAGSGKYFLRGLGTAVSAITGGLRIGDTTQPTEKLEVLGHVLLDNSGTASELRLREPSAGGGSYTGFVAPALAGNLIYTLPTTQGAADSILENNGSGVLSWQATTGDWLSQYLLLAGRAGSANDPILSTTTGGLISGSSASGQAIDIQSTTHATKGVINLRDETRLRTSFTGASSGQNYMERLAQDMSNADIGNITVLGLTGTWTQTADAVATHRLFNPGNATDNFIVQNASGVVTLPNFEVLSSGVRFRSNTADNVTAGSYFCIADNVQVLDTSTGTSTLTNLVTVRSAPTVTSGNTITNRTGLLMINRASTGTQTNFFGVDIESQTVGTLAVSLRSQGSNAQMRHAGPGVFGANAAPANANVGLEVQSTTQAFLLPRMTTTQRDAMTAVDGMMIYNTTNLVIEGRENGAWVNL